MLYLWRRTPTSNYVIRGTDAEGREIHQSTKTTSKAAAEALRVKLESRLLTERIHGKKAVITFDEAVESYLENGGSPRFLGAFNQLTNKWSGMMAHLVGVPMYKITQATCDDIVRALYSNCQPQTINRQFWAPFVAVWRHAAKREWCDLKIWERAKKRKGTNVVNIKPPRVGSYPVEYDIAWRFIKGMCPSNQCFMTILFYTGLRPIELFAMNSTQVDVSGRWITVPRSKIGEGRGVPIHEALVPMLTDLVAHRSDRLILTHQGVPYNASVENSGQIAGAISAARLRTHVFDVAPYTARHTVSTQLVVNGVHPHKKDQILGHAADDMSRHYTHVPRASLIEAINTLPTIPDWLEQDWMREPTKHWAKISAPLSKGQQAVGMDAQHLWEKLRRVA